MHSLDLSVQILELGCPGTTFRKLKIAQTFHSKILADVVIGNTKAGFLREKRFTLSKAIDLRIFVEVQKLALVLKVAESTS